MKMSHLIDGQIRLPEVEPCAFFPWQVFLYSITCIFCTQQRSFPSEFGLSKMLQSDYFVYSSLTVLLSCLASQLHPFLCLCLALYFCCTLFPHCASALPHTSIAPCSLISPTPSHCPILSCTLILPCTLPSPQFNIISPVSPHPLSSTPSISLWLLT